MSLTAKGLFYGLDISKWIPWLGDRQKWFDAEAQYYFASMTNGYTLKPSFNLAVHGKLFLNSQLYLDLSLGYTHMDYSTDPVLDVTTPAKTHLIYDSFSNLLGVGYRF